MAIAASGYALLSHPLPFYDVFFLQNIHLYYRVQVIAIDFADGMLESANTTARQRGLSNIIFQRGTFPSSWLFTFYSSRYKL